MTKRQLIDEIVSLNSTAQPAFLARFEDMDLSEYLQHLKNARTPRLSGDPHRYDKYFHAAQDASYPPANYGMDCDLAGTDTQERAALLGQSPAEPEMQSNDTPSVAAEQAQAQVEQEVDAQAQIEDASAAVATAVEEDPNDAFLPGQDDSGEQYPCDDFQQDEPTADAAIEPEAPATEQALPAVEAPAVAAEVPTTDTPAAAEAPAVEETPAVASPSEPVAQNQEAPAEAPAEAENKTARKPFAEVQEESQSWLF